MRSLLTVALCLVVTPAWAQAPGARATAGVLQPDADGAAGVGAQMIEVNPAGLGFGPGFELGLSYVNSGSGTSGEGFSLFAHVGGLDPYHTGLGVQLVNPPGQQDSLPAKISWAHSLRLGEVLSLGFTWHTFVADGDPALDGLDTWDVGLQVRPWRWIAAGLTVTDLTTPLMAGVPVDRGYEFALALRPGTERITLTGTARFEGDAELDPTPGARLQARLFGSLALVGRYDAVPVGGETAHRLMVGLADLGQFGLGLFGFAADASRAGQRSGVAATTRFRSRTEPLPALLPRPVVAEVTVGTGAEYAPAGFFRGAPSTPFLDTLLTLRKLARHDEVRAVIVAFGPEEMGWAQASELRQAIQALRQAGKQVWAWVPSGRTKTYSVAAAADRVFTAPAGAVLLTGVGTELLFVGDLLDKLGVKAQFVAIG
ncbi:MAG: S49 family peptidase, partial [Myxococcales bacterium]|nr:S49 family peptidase [Myxococcales bacterium]